MTEITAERGALNLLMNCAQARAGDRLLIAYEPASYGYFDADAARVLAAAARKLNLFVDTLDVGFNADAPRLTPELLSKMEQADVVVFLARLGDQLRFSDMPQGAKVIVSFAVTQELFGSGFSNGHHDAFLALKAEVNGVLAHAQEVRLTCPAGTDVVGRPHMDLSAAGDTSILRFPMSVFTPVPAHSFSGRVALPGFLTGTGSRYYEGYSVEFEGQVWAEMEQGRLTGFTGSAADVDRANAHYDRVATMFGIDRDFVHSWHAGLHPGCGYPWEARENYERWGGAAFGNPRILHFHTCGAYAPGEISWNVIDPTIVVDGLTLWDRGRFHAERLSRGPEILAQYSCAADLFRAPDRDIGLRHIA